LYWILLSLNAALFFALRYVVVKKYLNGVDTYLLAFSARFFSVIFLLPLLPFNSLKGLCSINFWAVIITTSLLTAAASIMQLHSIKNYDLSSSLPFLSFIPLFMILSVFLIFKELPSFQSIWGILLLTVGAYILNIGKNYSILSPIKNLLKDFGALLFFGVAVIFGLTTTLDRIGIENAGNSAFSYSFFWNIFSVLLFSLIFLNRKKNRLYFSQTKKNIIPLTVQGLFTIIAVYSQMLAIELAKGISANVIYVKALTLLQMFIGVIFGILIFKEKNILFRIIGSALMLAGAVIIIIVIQ